MEKPTLFDSTLSLLVVREVEWVPFDALSFVELLLQRLFGLICALRPHTHTHRLRVTLFLQLEDEGVKELLQPLVGEVNAKPFQERCKRIAASPSLLCFSRGPSCSKEFILKHSKPQWGLGLT